MINKDFLKWKFTAKVSDASEITHPIYERGEGHPIILIQELPGISEPVLALADRLAQNGYKVILPHLFGAFGKYQPLSNTFRVFCMRKEFQLFSQNKSSKITDWLRSLCREVAERNDAPGVAVIGMCLTGNFAIALMGDKNVVAAVASQPSLPLMKQGALHLSPEEITAARKRLDELQEPMLAYRFEEDKLSGVEKFSCIQAHFNSDGKERVRLKTLPGKGHSVLTYDFVDQAGHPTHQALKEILDYLGRSFEKAD